MADLIEGSSSSNSKKTNPSNVITSINGSSQITLYPLYSEYTYDSNTEEILTLPVSPADIMFNEDSNGEVIRLINYGELPVGMNRKLATWSVDSFFPCRSDGMASYSSLNKRSYYEKNKTFQYWFDISDGTKNPYDYCDKLLSWKNNQTPLVFMFETWGTYYNCQIKRFNYGRKDAIGNVYYQLDFQEYKEYTQFNNGKASSNYSADTYYPADGENILQIAKKLYGSSDYYQYFMKLNNMTTTEIKVGQAYKVR
jgi:hypothetical protein